MIQGKRFTQICKWEILKSGWRKKKAEKIVSWRNLLRFSLFIFFLVGKTRRFSLRFFLHFKKEYPGVYPMIHFDICYTMISDVCNLLASHLFKNWIWDELHPSRCSYKLVGPARWSDYLFTTVLMLHHSWKCRDYLNFEHHREIMTNLTPSIQSLFSVALHPNIPHMLASH